MSEARLPADETDHHDCHPDLQLSNLPLTPSTARSAKLYAYADVFVARPVNRRTAAFAATNDQQRPNNVRNPVAQSRLGRVVRPSIRPVESVAIPAATTVAFGRRE